jgi:hypothetical protein
MIFLPGLLANNEMAQRSIRRSLNPDSEEVFPDCLTKWEESVAHSILARSLSLHQRPYTFAQTNPVPLFFRLQSGGGPYIPSCRHPCKSLSREKTVLLTRAMEERAKRT